MSGYMEKITFGPANHKTVMIVNNNRRSSQKTLIRVGGVELEVMSDDKLSIKSHVDMFRKFAKVVLLDPCYNVNLGSAIRRCMANKILKAFDLHHYLI